MFVCACDYLSNIVTVDLCKFNGESITILQFFSYELRKPIKDNYLIGSVKFYVSSSQFGAFSRPKVVFPF